MGIAIQLCAVVVDSIAVEIIQEGHRRATQVMTVPVRTAVRNLFRAIIPLFTACGMSTHEYDDYSEDGDLARNVSLHPLFDVTTASYDGSEDGNDHEVQLTLNDKWVRGGGMFALRLRMRDAVLAFIRDANLALANGFTVHAQVFTAFRRVNVIRELVVEDLEFDIVGHV